MHKQDPRPTKANNGQQSSQMHTKAPKPPKAPKPGKAPKSVKAPKAKDEGLADAESTTVTDELE